MASTIDGSFVFRALADQGDHLSIDIHRIHFSGGGDRLRQLESKIAAARTEVGDDISGLEVERADDLIGLLPVVAVKAFVGALFKAGAPGDKQRGEQDEIERSPCLGDRRRSWHGHFLSASGYGDGVPDPTCSRARATF